MAATMFVDVGEKVQGRINAARRSAEDSFTEILAWLAPPRDERRLWEVEDALWKRVLALGRALLVLWFATRCPRSVPRVVRGPDGRFYRWHGLKKTVAKTVFGEVPVERSFYVIGGGKRGDTYVPLDHEVGLAPSRFSLRVIGCVAFLSAKMSFTEVGTTLHRFWGWAPATRSMLKMVDQVGPLARPFLESQPGPRDDGEILVVEVDGGGAPMITDTEMSRVQIPVVQHQAAFLRFALWVLPSPGGRCSRSPVEWAC
jgi:hypothetical protein